MDKLITTFTQNNINAYFVANKNAALKQILELAPTGSIVTFAGSKTIEEIGARDYFLQNSNQYTLIDPYANNLSKEQSYEKRRQGLLADILLTSSNAITEKGEIVNIDGAGNRVAGLNFGPKKVIIVAGINKIVPNLPAAWKRIATIAAPLNNKRLQTGNPCIVSGVCQNCNLPNRICRTYNIIQGQRIANRLHVIIVNENLGF